MTAYASLVNPPKPLNHLCALFIFSVHFGNFLVGSIKQVFSPTLALPIGSVCRATRVFGAEVVPMRPLLVLEEPARQTSCL